MSDCERVDLLVGLLEPPPGVPEDDALTPEERTAAEAHLAGCARCRERLEGLRTSQGAVRGLTAAAPGDEARARASAAVLEAMDQAAPLPAPADDRPTRGGGGGGVVVAFAKIGAAAACLLIVAALAVQPDAGDATARRDAEPPAAAPAGGGAAPVGASAPDADPATEADGEAAPRTPAPGPGRPETGATESFGGEAPEPGEDAMRLRGEGGRSDEGGGAGGGGQQPAPGDRPGDPEGVRGQAPAGEPQLDGAPTTAAPTDGALADEGAPTAEDDGPPPPAAPSGAPQAGATAPGGDAGGGAEPDPDDAVAEAEAEEREPERAARRAGEEAAAELERSFGALVVAAWSVGAGEARRVYAVDDQGRLLASVAGATFEEQPLAEEQPLGDGEPTFGGPAPEEAPDAGDADAGEPAVRTASVEALAEAPPHALAPVDPAADRAHAAALVAILERERRHEPRDAAWRERVLALLRASGDEAVEADERDALLLLRLVRRVEALRLELVEEGD